MSAIHPYTVDGAYDERRLAHITDPVKLKDLMVDAHSQILRLQKDLDGLNLIIARQDARLNAARPTSTASGERIAELTNELADLGKTERELRERLRFYKRALLTRDGRAARPRAQGDQAAEEGAEGAEPDALAAQEGAQRGPVPRHKGSVDRSRATGDDDGLAVFTVSLEEVASFLGLNSGITVADLEAALQEEAARRTDLRAVIARHAAERDRAEAGIRAEIADVIRRTKRLGREQTKAVLEIERQLHWLQILSIKLRTTKRVGAANARKSLLVRDEARDPKRRPADGTPSKPAGKAVHHPEPATARRPARDSSGAANKGAASARAETVQTDPVEAAPVSAPAPAPAKATFTRVSGARAAASKGAAAPKTTAAKAAPAKDKPVKALTANPEPVGTEPDKAEDAAMSESIQTVEDVPLSDSKQSPADDHIAEKKKTQIII